MLTSKLLPCLFYQPPVKKGNNIGPKQRSFIDPSTVKPLKGKQVLHLITLREPTKRRILWIIQNRKEAFNPLFHTQFSVKSAELRKLDSDYTRALRMLDCLEIDGLVKQDKDYNWRVTIKGQCYRLITNTYFQLCAILLPIIITIAFHFM